MRNEISPIISEMIARENINETEISSLCHSEDNEHTKRAVEALILSYLYTFMNADSEVGPGDLAAEEHFMMDFIEDKLMLMFNDMTGSSLPASILSVPQLLVRLTESEENNPGGQITSYLNSNISPLAFHRYRDTWEVFRRGDGKLYFFCKLSAFGRLSSEIFSLHALILGGILGLFTGMSILSMVEVVYWITRYFVRR